jgi:hypothetical protein
LIACGRHPPSTTIDRRILFISNEENMKKDEVFLYALQATCEVTGLEAHVILDGRDEDASDARYVLVITLGHLLSDTDMARQMHRTKQGVGHIRRNEKKGLKWLVRRNLQELGKRMENLCLGKG